MNEPTKRKRSNNLGRDHYRRLQNEMPAPPAEQPDRWRRVVRFFERTVGGAKRLFRETSGTERVDKSPSRRDRHRAEVAEKVGAVRRKQLAVHADRTSALAREREAARWKRRVARQEARKRERVVAAQVRSGREGGVGR